MNLDQMEFRCPDAEVIGNVVVKDYRLVFRGNSRGNGVASILPEQGEQVSGVLWSITEKCEKSLDYYEGYPYLYGKQDILVQCEDGQELYAAVYIMNEPYQFQTRAEDQDRFQETGFFFLQLRGSLHPVRFFQAVPSRCQTRRHREV